MRKKLTHYFPVIAIAIGAALGLTLVLCSGCGTPCKPVIKTAVKFKVLKKKVFVPIPIRVPQPRLAVFNHIHFETNSKKLSKKAQKFLKQLATFLTYTGIHVRLEGHCDHRGSTTYNLQLSHNRAYEAASFLILHGVPSDRLDIRSYGETQRIDDTKTEEGMEKNRRVEIHPIKADSH